MNEEKRLEILLTAFEENLRREIFFIRRKEAENLLELLHAQGDLIIAISEIVERIQLPEPRAAALRKRLADADDMREANRAEADRVTADMRQELDEMKLARQRIRQARQLSKRATLSHSCASSARWQRSSSPAVAVTRLI